MLALIEAIEPASGHVTHNPGLKLGYVPQKLAVDPSLPITVERFLSLPKRVSHRVAERALDRTGVPGLLKRQMSNLSGGQFQRVMLARAPEYRALFWTGTKGTLALYRHQHSHSHDHDHDHTHEAH